MGSHFQRPHFTNTFKIKEVSRESYFVNKYRFKNIFTLNVTSTFAQIYFKLKISTVALFITFIRIHIHLRKINSWVFSNVFLPFEISLESVLKHILILTNQCLPMDIQQRVKTVHETRTREETRVAKNRCVAQETVEVIAKAV